MKTIKGVTLESGSWYLSEDQARTLASDSNADKYRDISPETAGWTYVAVEVPSRLLDADWEVSSTAWAIDVYDEDGERLGAL